MGYLVIGRKVGERILIGDEIVIMVTDINWEEHTVHIAIDAPRELTISRRGTHMEEGDADGNRAENHTRRQY